MGVLHEYDWIVGLGTVFAFLDAWNIGANDVANSWSTSVSSRSLSYIQAMGLASAFEFSGAVGVGDRVADTIRTKVIDTDNFKDNPAVLMLGMFCAVIASSTYLTVCTRIGLPVSSTHTIMGGVIGMGIALVGSEGIHWANLKHGGIDSGVISVFLTWVIAPGLAGAFAAIIFLITKYAVMLRRNPAWRGLCLVPFYFGVTASLIVMLVIWKGGRIHLNMTSAQTGGLIVGIGAGIAVLAAVFLVPWLYRIVIRDDWQLRWYHIPLGPMLLQRPNPLPQPQGAPGGIADFYEGHLTRNELDEMRRVGRGNSDEFERADDVNSNEIKLVSRDGGIHEDDTIEEPIRVKERKSLVGPKPVGVPWYSAEMIFWYMKLALFHGVDKDIVSLQHHKTILSPDLSEMHANVPHYDNHAEFLYTFMQILTACTASFVHGANDVANAVAPYASIYQIWQMGKVPGTESQVPIWILCFAGVAIVLGLWTYGYNMMRNLGNRLTLHSPSRGFSMELGSAITVTIATRLGLPVSTTQCITGATVGVGLCSGTWRSINWRMVAWIYFGWIVTLPVVGIISGCICAMIIHAPRWGMN